MRVTSKGRQSFSAMRADGRKGQRGVEEQERGAGLQGGEAVGRLKSPDSGHSLRRGVLKRGAGLLRVVFRSRSIGRGGSVGRDSQGKGGSSRQKLCEGGEGELIANFTGLKIRSIYPCVTG